MLGEFRRVRTGEDRGPDNTGADRRRYFFDLAPIDSAIEAPNEFVDPDDNQTLFDEGREREIRSIAKAREFLMKGDRRRAAEALLAADDPALLDYFTWASTPSLRGGSLTPSRAQIPTEQQPPRITPLVKEMRELHRRDGFRCRYCSIRVIDNDVFRKLRAMLPEALRWGRSNVEQHAGFLCLRASHDHVVPRAFDGANALKNYVTACWVCQFGRGDSLLEDLGVADPFLRPPIHDEWDGLRRILTLKSSSTFPLA